MSKTQTQPHSRPRGFSKGARRWDEIGYPGWIQIGVAAPTGGVKDCHQHLKFLKDIFPA